jgi:ATP-dependent helicase/nuclease subunit A
MAFEPTIEQIKAIDAAGSVIVSAAAGSGKTAVLVERVAKLLADAENPLYADKILIVTFTNAAAAELRTRIDKRLAEEFKRNPDNLHLQRQRILLAGAKISTIDSFCIDFLKENFEICGINPAFRIAENATINTLSKIALSSLINEYFESGDEEFVSLLQFLGEDYDDSKLQKCINNIFSFSRNMPFPHQWLDNIVTGYERHAKGESRIWFDETLDFVKALAEDARLDFQNAIDLLETSPEAYGKYNENSNYFLDATKEIFHFCEDKNWDCLFDFLCSVSAPKCKNLSAAEKTDAVLASIELRNNGKKNIDKIRKIVYGTVSAIAEETKCVVPFVRKIVSLVNEFETRFYSELEKQNLMTFYMVEQTVLSTLASFENGKVQGNEKSKSFADRFDAVFVDEYQDTNSLQDTLFSILSDNGKKLFCVGDMKQCIYKFRGANPTNFLIKKKSADADRLLDSTDSMLRVDLGCNFRSRKEVCYQINEIFRKILYKDNSDFDYDDNEKLLPMAKYPDNDDTKVEYHFIDYGALTANSNIEFSSMLNAEAEAVANLIEDHMNKAPFLRDGDVLRKAKYSDFTILVRSMREKGDVFIKTLKARGIPVTAASSDIIESDEVITLISLLKLINNPSDDIALVTVLTSSLFSFSMDEIAKIRAGHKYGNLVSSLMAASKSGNKKVTEFFDILSKLRKKNIILSIAEIIEEIFEETNLLNIFSSANGGDVKRHNLLCVQNFAESFEGDGKKSIREFINYFTELENKDFNMSASSGECVKVMSIHKSKGLQFPICILANTSNQFNMQDLRDAFLINEIHGFSAVYYDKEDKKIDNTVLRTVMKQYEHRQLLAEELRIFYVALTRAEEKLITFTTYDDLSKEISDKIRQIEFTYSSDKVEYSLFRKSVSYANWIIESLIIDGKKDALLGLASDPNIFVHKEINVSQADVETDQTFEPNPQSVDSLKTSYAFEYPYSELIGLEAKTSVTDIVHKADDRMYRFTKRPSFLQEDGLSFAEKGTATHKVMQHIDFGKARISLNMELERLVEYLYLTDEEAKALNVNAINDFLNSDICDRIMKSSFVRKEMRFLTEFSATELKPELSHNFADEMIIVQGAVDLVFEDDGKLIIIDFKTDRNKDENALLEAYSEQLKIYSKALQKILNRRVSQLYIYSFTIGKFIEVQ